MDPLRLEEVPVREEDQATFAPVSYYEDQGIETMLSLAEMLGDDDEYRP